MPSGHITVRVGQLPGQINEFALNGNRTVADACAVAGLDPDGFEVRVNSQHAELDTPLNNGDIVLLVREVKGNS